MRLLDVAGWPAVLLHECTHAVAAAPFARTAINWQRTVPYTELRWRSGTPRWAVRFAHLAPTIVGVLATLLTVAFLAPLLSFGMPSNPFHAGAAGLLVAYNWLLYCWPSAADRRPFAGVNG